MATPLNSGAASFVLRIHSGGEGSRRSLIQAKRCHSRRKGSSKEQVGLKRKRGRFQNSQGGGLTWWLKAAELNGDRFCY